ncbi:MAG: glycosyltransferase [Ignavibacteriaceae bacterium]
MKHIIKTKTLEAYEKYAGPETIERIYRKAKGLKDLHLVSVNSTYYGGGVAELLSSLILLFNSVGITAGWRVIQGSPDFFNITKKMHNALQGASINLSKIKKEIYEQVIEENVIRNHIDHDFVIIHDPQPLPMINYYRKRGPWVWRCHVDLTSPARNLWEYLRTFIEKYDAAIFTLEDYRQDLSIPQVFLEPAIDPFSIINQDMSDSEIDERLKYYSIPTDLPLIVQVSRFDTWKDPEGVIKAFKIARKDINATLVLLGNVATDDPEGEHVYNNLINQREERIIILSKQDSALVNALQRKAAVVLQKSLREGFGLTVTEAMFKGAAVIGGNTGGIKKQITHGKNGFLVSSVEEAASYMVKLVKDPELRKEIGKNAKESAIKKYLLSAYLEKYLDLINSFDANFKLRTK